MPRARYTSSRRNRLGIQLLLRDAEAAQALHVFRANGTSSRPRTADSWERRDLCGGTYRLSAHRLPVVEVQAIRILRRAIQSSVAKGYRVFPDSSAAGPAPARRERRSSPFSASASAAPADSTGFGRRFRPFRQAGRQQAERQRSKGQNRLQPPPGREAVRSSPDTAGTRLLPAVPPAGSDPATARPAFSKAVLTGHKSSAPPSAKHRPPRHGIQLRQRRRPSATRFAAARQGQPSTGCPARPPAGGSFLRSARCPESAHWASRLASFRVQPPPAPALRARQALDSMISPPPGRWRSASSGRPPSRRPSLWPRATKAGLPAPARSRTSRRAVASTSAFFLRPKPKSRAASGTSARPQYRATGSTQISQQPAAQGRQPQRQHQGPEDLPVGIALPVDGAKLQHRRRPQHRRRDGERSRGQA